MAATLSLDRCMTSLHLDQIEADRARFRPLRSDAMAHRLLGILWHQTFELALGALVVSVGLSGLAKQRRKCCPGIGSVHVDHANRFDARLRRFAIEQHWRFARLDRPPESFFGG